MLLLCIYVVKVVLSSQTNTISLIIVSQVKGLQLIPCIISVLSVSV